MYALNSILDAVLGFMNLDGEMEIEWIVGVKDRGNGND